MSYLRYVRVIGTMHVSPRSREDVVRTILKERPNAIAVELDRARFLAMEGERKATLGDAIRLGKGGLINYALAKLEERLGEEFGMRPGGDMRAAVEVARRFGIPLFLIDENIDVIIGKIAAAPGREKLLMALESLAVFLPVKPGDEMPDPLEEYRFMMAAFRRRYPYLYRVLVEERNEIMARNLISIVDSLRAAGVRKPRVVAIVGLGHKQGIEHLLDRWKTGTGRYVYI
ncbi:TraB/GumN family protein [Thermococcus sp.]|uniref:TraB domain-containing protein n=1 Tax=Thermococcus sp. TaxID=35749 RepID=UPI00261B0AD9|nr:TraB/GumN family protein [Thermococcus sp.]